MDRRPRANCTASARLDVIVDAGQTTRGVETRGARSKAAATARVYTRESSVERSCGSRDTCEAMSPTGRSVPPASTTGKPSSSRASAQPKLRYTGSPPAVWVK